MPEAAVTVVVVNWNSGDDLGRCLESVGQQSRPPRQVVVVDNASTDGSAERAAAAHPDVRFELLDHNSGFCGGANRGVQRACGDAVLVLNPDAWLAADFLEQAMPALARAGVGFVAAKVLRADGVTIDSAGQTLSPVIRKVVERGYGERDVGQLDEAGPVDSVCGAVALYGAPLIARLAPDGHLFDEDFFAFWEDADVGARARRAGFSGWYEPAALAHHRRGATRVSEARLFGRQVQLLGRDPAVQYHILKNRYLFLLKNEPITGLLLRAPVLALVDGGLLALVALLRPALFRRLLGIGPLLRTAWSKRSGYA